MRKIWQNPATPLSKNVLPNESKLYSVPVSVEFELESFLAIEMAISPTPVILQCAIDMRSTNYV